MDFSDVLMVTWDSAASSKISMEHIFVSTLYKKKKSSIRNKKYYQKKEKKREIVILYADLAYEWCDLTKKDYTFINLFN